jgi:hypothetical protein
MNTPKNEKPFIVMSGKNDCCPIVVEPDASAIELAGAERLARTISSLGGRSGIRSADSPDDLTCQNNKAVILCRRGGTLEKTILLPQAESLDGDKDNRRNKEGFLIRAHCVDGRGNLVVFGDSPGLFYGAITVADRLHFDQQGDLVTEETQNAYSPVLDKRIISTFVVQSPNNDYDSQQWKDGEDYDWKGFIDWLAGFRINHLLIQNNAEESGLTYPSRKFPQIVNRNAANVQKEFYGDLIDYAHTRNIKVFLFGFHFPVNALPMIVYPETIAPNCDPANVPAFSSDYGEKKGEHDFRYLLGNYFSCLSHPRTREFWKDYIDEMLSVYPQIDGLVIGGAEGVDRRDKGPQRVCECLKCQGMKNIQRLLTEIFDVIYQTAMSHKPELEIAVVDRPEYGLLWEHVERQGYDNVAIYNWCCRYPRYPSGFSGEWANRWDFTDDAWIMGKFGGVGHLPKIIRAAREHKAPLVNMTYWNKEVEIAYAAMSEFSWNPDLTFEQFGELYTIKTFRKKHRQASRAVALFAEIMDKVENPLYLFSFRDDDLATVMEQFRELEGLVPEIPETSGTFCLKRYLDTFVKGFEKGLKYRNLTGCTDISRLVNEDSYQRHNKYDVEFFSG